jgi:chromate transporter
MASASVGRTRMVLLFRLKWSVLRTLGLCAVLGLAAGLAGFPV